LGLIAPERVSQERRSDTPFPADLPPTSLDFDLSAVSIAYELSVAVENFFTSLSILPRALRRLGRRRKDPPMIEFKPRIFVLPAIALAVVAMLHGAADGGRSTPKSGATVRIAHPAVRASFEAFHVSQSVAAARRCQVACNN
jgi:hypothetical protein